MAKTERDFQNEYERLSQDGKCDSPGGMEYERVLREWQSLGCPSDIENFIVVRANIGPEGTGREINN